MSDEMGKLFTAPPRRETPDGRAPQNRSLESNEVRTGQEAPREARVRAGQEAQREARARADREMSREIKPRANREAHQVRVSQSVRARDNGGKRSARWKAVAIVAVVLAIAAIAAAGWFAWRSTQPDARLEPGAYLISQGSMTDEEAQGLVDEIAESSRITISVAATMELSADGQLRVNFIVPEPNNGLSERLEVEQDGRVVCRTGVVEPGYMMEWAPSSGAEVGSATATVYAVSESGADSGNPTSVEIEIVAAREGEESADDR